MSARSTSLVADWSKAALSCSEFVNAVQSQAASAYRSFPWRNINDAYGVLVSEVMLQQTQVARVEKYWPVFMSQFPAPDALAAADVATVLEAWQGLGYNRRALALKRACEVCSVDYAGLLPESEEELLALPGVGPATAAGVVAFAHDRPAVYIETNVRTVVLHHLLPDAERVTDRVLRPYLHEACGAAMQAGMRPRAWYYALLDIGAALKAQGSVAQRRSAHYARQSAFEGSRRQKRSYILRSVLEHPEGVPSAEVHVLLNESERKAGRGSVALGEFESIVADLAAEGFFACWEQSGEDWLGALTRSEEL